MPRHHATVGYCCALLALACVAPQSRAAPPSTEFSAEVGFGAEYDSNVSVDELDATINQSDSALTLDAELQLEHAFNDSVELNLSYDFSQTMYEEFDQLNRQTHLVGTDLVVDLGEVNSGITLYYINARLDGNDFLEYYRASPYLSGFLSKRWFARGAYVYADKRIEQNPGRDAEGHAGELDLYFFRRGLRSYFNFGYRFRDEDANAERFDYTANEFKLRYIHRLDLWDQIAKLELGWRYEDRDYSGITPSIGVEREDERQVWNIDLEYPLLEKGAIELYTNYSDYASNYPRADYDQYVVGTRLSWRW